MYLMRMSGAGICGVEGLNWSPTTTGVLKNFASASSSKSKMFLARSHSWRNEWL